MPVNARELLVKNKATGQDPLVDKILTEGSPEQAMFHRAVEFRKSPLKAMYIEACLLASHDYENIGDILELDPNLVELYSNVFYDVADLDKLSKLELLNVKDRQENLLKIWAMSQGLEFISWRLGKKTTVNPIQGLQELFSTAMYKAKEACFSGNASEESKEAVKWSKMAMDLARLLKFYTTDENQIQKDLKFALAEAVPEFEGFGELNKE